MIRTILLTNLNYTQEYEQFITPMPGTTNIGEIVVSDIITEKRDDIIIGKDDKIIGQWEYDLVNNNLIEIVKLDSTELGKYLIEGSSKHSWSGWPECW